MANTLVAIVKGFVDDTTDAISTKLGPLMESFTRKTGDLVAQNADDLNTAESNVTDSITGVLKNGDSDVPPGDVVPAGAPADTPSTAPGSKPGNLNPPEPPTDADPVTTSGVGPCGKAGEPVDVVTGQYVTAKTDLELPGVLPLVLRRAYASGYRGGRLFGPGWSSTLDIRVQIGVETIRLADDDCRILEFPNPRNAGSGGGAGAGIGTARSVFPAEGERLALTWDRDQDEIRVQNTATGHTWHFTTIGATRTGVGGSGGTGGGSGGTEEIRPLTALSDRNGNRIVFERDEDGIPTEVRHSGGYRVAVDSVYTATGLRAEALRLLDGTNGNQGSPVLTYQYDPRGRLIGLVDSSGAPFIFEHDGNDRIAAWIDRTGYRFEYTYDQAGRVVRTRGDGGYLSGSFIYDPDKRVTVYTDSLGNPTEHHYDQSGHVTKVVNQLGHASITEYDRKGQVLSRTDELGNTTRFTLDENGDPVRVERADGSVVEVAYGPLRLPVKVTGSDGASWRYEYNERGNLVSVVDPAGAITSYAYGDRGQPLQVTDALGGVSTIVSNPAGLAMAATGQSGSVQQVVRDSRGQVVSATDPLGSVTGYVRDGEGRIVSSTHSNGAAETWEWDAAGNLIAHADQLGRVTSFEFGPFNKAVARTDADGTRHVFAHDTELRLVSVTNPQDLTWSYTYDAAGNLVGEQDFNGRVLAYGHDPAGQIIRRVNGAGQSVELDRDALGRIIGQHASDGRQATFEYDANGNLARASAAGTDVVFTRDAVGRVLTETSGDRTLTNTYDVLGRRLTRTTPAGHQSVWQYDQVGRPVILGVDTRQIAFGYDASGHETHRWISPDAALTNEWDAHGRLTARRVISVEGPAEGRTSRLRHERTWTYQVDGTPASIADSATGTSQLDLDPLGRITAVTANTWSERYAYDSSGNLTHAQDTRVPDAPASGPRELSGTLLRQAGRTRYEYDAQGRVIKSVRRTLSGTQKTWTYAYDADDRLIEATNPRGEHWQYSYDALGRRISKRRLDEQHSVVEEIRFAWDGFVLAEQDRVVAELPTATTITWDHEPGTFIPVAQSTRTFYTAAPQQLVDEQFHAIVTDLVGTPTELASVTGEIVWRRQAGLWGDSTTREPEGSADCRLRFPGQYHDAETGLSYNYLRYYDPETARYTTPDPLGFAPAPNHHAYVSNPLIWTDALGLAPRRLKVDVVAEDWQVKGLHVHMPSGKEVSFYGQETLDKKGNPTGKYEAKVQTTYNTPDKIASTSDLRDAEKALSDSKFRQNILDRGSAGLDYLRSNYPKSRQIDGLDKLLKAVQPDDPQEEACE